MWTARQPLTHLAPARLGAIRMNLPLTQAWMYPPPLTPAWALTVAGAMTARASDADTTMVPRSLRTARTSVEWMNAPVGSWAPDAGRATPVGCPTGPAALEPESRRVGGSCVIGLGPDEAVGLSCRVV